jgi:O-antigen/teichoic acid export membrane protein
VSSLTEASGAEPFDAAGATTGASVLRGSAWSVLSSLLPQIYVVVQSVVAARFLGPVGMGRQSFIAFIELSAVMLSTGGLPLALAREIGSILGGRRPEAVRGILAWAWRIELVAAVIGGGALVVSGQVSSGLRSSWLLAAVAATMAILHSVPSAVLIGMQRWRDASVVGIATGSLATGATVIVLAAGGGIPGMFAVEAVTSVLNLLLTGWLARRAVLRLPSRAESAPDLRELRRSILRFSVVGWVRGLLALIVWRRSEFIFLRRYSTDSEIALYSVAFGAATMLVALPNAIAGVISPAVSTLMGAGADHRIRSGFGRSIRFMLYASLPLTAATLAFGPAGIRLIYGKDYQKAGDVLLVMMALFPLLPVVNVSSILLWNLGRLRFLVVSSLVAAAADIGMDLILIPHLGAIGAALANGAAQLVATVPVVVYVVREMRPVRFELGAVFRVGVISACSVILGLVAARIVVGGSLVGPVSDVRRVAGVGSGMLLGAIVFTVVAGLIGMLPADDAAWLDEAAGERLGGLVGLASRFWSRS